MINTFTWFLFPLILAYFLAPTIRGIIGVTNYKLSKLDYQKHEFTYTLIQLVVSLLFFISSIALVLFLWYKIIYFAFVDYIVSVGCCLLISITASDKIYLPAETEIDSSLKAFRKGFTEGLSFRLFPFLPTKTIIHIIYLAILVTSQVITLYFKDSWIHNSEFYRFLEINKYGIVIMYAFEKIISSISSKEEKERIKIMQETSDVLEKQEQEDRKKRQQEWQELKELLKQIKLKRSEKKRQNKK